MKYDDGGYIDLVWEYSPDACYIRGHVSHEDGIETLLDEGAIENAADVGQANHLYGRWSMEPRWDGENGHTLKTYKNPGRGCFKVTEFVKS